MDINELIAIVKKKIENKIDVESIDIKDKSYLHKKHAGKQKGKYHLKITLESIELKKMSLVDSNKKIYKILEKELKQFIHSIQILIQ